MTSARYSDLLHQAASRLEQGRRELDRRFDDRASAYAMIADREAVLSALEAHVWAIVTPGRAAAVRSAFHPDDIEAAAMRLVDALTKAVGTEKPHPSLLTMPRSPWARAAQAIRAASDLLAVHHDASGTPRTPVASLLQSADFRDAALGQVAALTTTTTSVDDLVALRVGQAGVPWPTVRLRMPNVEQVASAAHELSGSTREGDLSTLGAVGLVPAKVHTDDNIAELTDRLTRVRQRAWELPTAPDRSVATLRDLATIAVAIHAHAAVFHTGENGPAAPLVARGRRWQALSSKLAPMVSLMPHDPSVHADLVAFAHLLPAVAPISGPGRATSADPDKRRVGAALGACVALTPELAQNGARAFAVLARTHDLFVPARSLTGDEITDDPALVSARLHGALAPASGRQVEQVAGLYKETGSDPMRAPSTAAQQFIGMEPVRLERF